MVHLGTESTYQFKAFISYSHQDRAVAEWVHDALERYSVPKELVGKETPKGTVRRKLGQIFIDRFELAAGPLTAQISTALAQSQNLIVICSPHASKSIYVAQEITEFLRLSSRANIFAVMVGGKRFAPACECFPQPLRMIAADARSDAGRCSQADDADLLAADLLADGKHLARLKLVAGLIGVSLDELRRRDVVAERRRRQRWTALAGFTSTLAVSAIGMYFVADHHKNLAVHNLKLADLRHEQSIEIAMGFASNVAKMTEDLRIPSDSAQGLLKEADDVLKKLMRVGGREELGLRISADMALNHAEALARLNTPFDREQRAEVARSAFARLREIQPNKWEYVKGYGDANLQLGIALRDQGYLDSAVLAFQRTLEVREEALLRQPHYRGAGEEAAAGRSVRRDLALTHLLLGRVLNRQGNVRAARVRLDEALSLRRELAALDTHDTDGQLASTEVEVEIADGLSLGGNERQRLKILADVVERRRVLAKVGTRQKRFLAWALIFYGEALLESGETVTALRILEDARSTMSTVHASDENSNVAQKDMAWAEGHLGDALLALGRIEEAIDRYGRGLGIAEESLRKDGLTLLNRRNVAYWLTRRGSAMRSKGDLAAARQDLQNALDFLARDSTVDPTNRMMRSELAATYHELGRVEQSEGDFEAASRLLSRAAVTYAAIAGEVEGALVWQERSEIAARESQSVVAAAVEQCRRQSKADACVAGWSGQARPGDTADRVVLEPQ